MPNNISYYFIEKNLATSSPYSLPNSDYIIHLAAKTDAAQSAKYEKEFYENNLEATKNIIKYSKKKKSKLIFASTTSIYGPQSNEVNENCSSNDLNPQSPYADIKIKEEKLIAKRITSKNSYLILRLGTIYGFSEGIRFHTAINKFCLQACMRVPLTVWKTAYNQKRPYLSFNVSDNYGINLSSLLLNISGGSYPIYHRVDNSIYNLLSYNKKVSDIIKIINKKVSTKINFVNHPIMNQLSYEISNKKFCDTNYKFKSNLEEDINKIIDRLININS